MKNKLIKKITYMIPLVAGILILYGAISGKLQGQVDFIKGKIESADKLIEDNKIENKTEDSMEVMNEIPPGKINLYEWFDEWAMEPKVETYDPEHKIAKNYVYGITAEEDAYRQDLYEEQEKITEEMKIPSEYIGGSIYNKDKLLPWDSTFEIKFNQAYYTYSNFEIRDDFSGLDPKYYTDDKDKLLELLDENGKLKGATMVNKETEEIIKDVECKLVMFDITITPYSDWVVERQSIPYLDFLKDKGNALEHDYSGYAGEAYELNIVSDFPVYYDLGLYDFETAGPNVDTYACPMRKGEVITFRVGYIVPVMLMDQAYFVFNPNCYNGTDFSYATEDIAIFKVEGME